MAEGDSYTVLSVERIVRARASHYLINPEILGALGADPAAMQDRFSSNYLVALIAQAIRDVAAAQEKAGKAKKKLATFTLQTDVRFATAADRNAFAEELSNAVARLTAKYHDERAEGGRSFRFLVAAYPSMKKKA